MNTPASIPAKPASLTSFSQLFGRKIDGQSINEIEIPLIQRDYAQGRKTENVNRIRESFIDSLCGALLPDAPAIDLDFIFGDVEGGEGENKGKFYPLDGQQRLTTLFLLHCYLAWRADARLEDQAWRKFSYATRPGARDFCDFLVRCQPEFSDSLSAWIKDHADYLPTWQNDPSIQSMLVVLDALHGWFVAKQPNLQVAWSKLIDQDNPAIRFHVLTMKANGLTDALYIKMNSRGKPLTAFENFKAHFEDLLKKAHPDKVSGFALKIDTDWSEVLWPYRGEDHLIDDEFMRYFRFVTEISAWKNEISFKDNVRDDDLAKLVYGPDAKNAASNLTLLFQAFDVWKDKNVKAQFESVLTAQPDGKSTTLLMFGSFENEGVDLFHACCRYYGTPRQWSLANTLLFYGVLLSFIHQVPESDSPKRLRALRNLIEASEDEIRAGERNNMPKLLVEVEQVVIHNNLQNVRTFNQVQQKNELAKAAMLEAMPNLATDLYMLEDHNLLRGGLTAFDLDPLLFSQRAQTFVTVFEKSAYSGTSPWKLMTGALLANGDYSRQEARWTGHRFADFGAPKNDEPWQVLFRGKRGDSTHPTSMPLMSLLDTLQKGISLQMMIDAYKDAPQTLKDWRYYFVTYDMMRDGASGRYTISQSGYQVCMLDKERMSSDYYDPYLLAVAKQGNVPLDRIANVKWPRCFTSDETNSRKLALKNSGLEIECVDLGWQITGIPRELAQIEAFERVCANFGIGGNYLYSVPQDAGIDSEDRIVLGAALLARLVQEGL